MDWQCLQWGEQFSAGRLVGRIPSCSHWIIALNHSHVGRIPFWGSSQYCQTPAVAIEWYYARSEILFIKIPIWFFPPPFQSLVSNDCSKTYSQEHFNSALCQHTSSHRVKICSSLCWCRNSKVAQDTKTQSFLQHELCRVTQVRRSNILWLTEG